MLQMGWPQLRRMVRQAKRRVRRARARQGQQTRATAAQPLRPTLEALEPRVLLTGTPMGLEWAVPLQSDGAVYVESLDVDSTGQVFAGGSFEQLVDFDPGPSFNGANSSLGKSSAYLASYTDAGQLNWFGALTGNGGDSSYIAEVAIHNDTDYYVLGTFSGTVDFDVTGQVDNRTAAGSGTDIFVALYDQSGNLQWVQTFGNIQSEAALGMDVDSNGNVTVVGTFRGTVDFAPGEGIENRTSGNSGSATDGFAVTFDSAGDFVGVGALSSDSSSAFNDVAYDANDNLVFVGVFQGSADLDPTLATVNNNASAGFNDVFLLRTDTSFSPTQLITLGGTGNESFSAVAVDATGNVYVTGTYSSAFDLDPGAGSSSTGGFGFTSKPLVASYDSTGNFRWGAGLGSSGGEGRAIVLDPLSSAPNTVLVGGYFTGTMDLDPSAATSNATSAGGGDGFVLRLNTSTGALNDGFTVGGAGQDDLRTLAGDPTGGDRVHTGVQFGGTVDFDPGTPVFALDPQGGTQDSALAVFGAPTTGYIEGTVFADVNGNATFDGIDRGWEGFFVYLDTNANDQRDSEEPFAVTDHNGHYLFAFVAAGVYTVRVEDQTNWTRTAPLSGEQPVTVDAGDVTAGHDFGFQPDLGTVSGRVFIDSNDNGAQDTGEAGQAGITVFLDSNYNGQLDPSEIFAVTDANGDYELTGVPPFDFDLRQQVPDGFVQAAPDRIPAAAGYTLINHQSNGDQTDGFTSNPMASMDGRFVIYESTATNLVPGDTNGEQDIFVYDVLLDTTTRVSVHTNGAESDAFSQMADISDDGRYAVFATTATTLTDDTVTASTYNIFLHDLQTGETRLISRNSNGEGGNGDSLRPSISGDGMFVVFDSLADDLVASDTNTARDVFLYDVANDTLTLISKSAGNVQSSNDSSEAVISGDGMTIAFASGSGSLAGTFANGTHIYVYDRQGNTLEIVDRASGFNGTLGDSLAALPSISYDGSRVGFLSHATNLVTGDTNNVRDFFVRDRNSHTTFRATIGDDGRQVQSHINNAKLNDSGEVVGFLSNTNQLDFAGQDNNNRTDLFFRFLEDEETDLVNRQPDFSLSNGAPYAFAMTGFGEGGFFSTDATDLIDNDTNSAPDLFLLNLTGAYVVEFLTPGETLTHQNFANILPPGDSPLDLVTSNTDSPTHIAYTHNHGNGTFGAVDLVNEANATIILGPLAHGDFDGDGDQDVIAGNLNGSGIHLYRNDAGALSGGISMLTGNAPVAAGGNKPVDIAVGDFNGDGLDDAAVLNQNDGSVSIFLGRGVDTGAFFLGADSTFDVGAGPSSIFVGDYDGDDLLDLGVLNADDFTLSLFTGDGAAGFSFDQYLDTGEGARDGFFIDLDGDTFLDIIYLNQTDQLFTWHYGDGNGGFGLPNSAVHGLDMTRMTVGDVNGDDLPDVVTTLQNTNQVAVFIANGGGDFNSPALYGAGTKPTAVQIGDLNGDHLPDIAVTNRNVPDPDGVSILFNQGGGLFGAPQLTEMGSDPEDLILVDLDAVGDPVPVNFFGSVFSDLNSSGGHPEEGENGLAGYTVYFDANTNGILDEYEPTFITDSEGSFSAIIAFTTVGNVQFRVDLSNNPGESFPPGFLSFDVERGQTIENIDFGIQAEPLGSISGVKFNDVDGDGEQDEGEDGLQGWTIFLDLNLDGDLDPEDPQTTTGSDGSYTFANLTPGDYHVYEVNQLGWVQTTPLAGFHDVTVADFQDVTDVDFGNQAQLEITIDQLNLLSNETLPTFSGTLVDSSGNLDLETAQVFVTLINTDTSNVVAGPLAAFVNIESATPTWSVTLTNPLPEGNYSVQLNVDLDSGAHASAATTYELDTTGPVVYEVIPGDGQTVQPPTEIIITFLDANAMDAASVQDPSNYQLQFAGADNTFDQGDDDVQLVSFITSIDLAGSQATLHLNPSAINTGDGHYRLTLLGNATITDAAGNALDGDFDNEPGGNFSGTLIIDSTAPTADADDLTTTDSNPTLTGSLSDYAGQVQVTLVNVDTGAAVNDGGNPFDALVIAGTWSLDLSLFPFVLPDGRYHINLSATDVVGNSADYDHAGLLTINDSFDGSTGGDDNLAIFASPISTDGTPQHHSLHAPADEDWATFTLAAGEFFTIQAASDGGEDLTVTLYGPNSLGTQVDTQTGAGLAQITGNLPAGQYWVQVIGNGTDVVPAYELTVASLPDLQVQIVGDTFAADPLLGDAATVDVEIHNTQGADATGNVLVEIFLSSDGALDGNDTLIGSQLVSLASLSAGNHVSAAIDVTPPTTLTTGSYQLIARVDQPDAVAEQDENNNTDVDEQSLLFRKLLGNVGAGQDTVITLTDADGTQFRAVWTRPGVARFIEDGEGGIDLLIDDTTSSSGLTLTALSGGNGRIDLDDIVFTGPAFGRLNAATTDLGGDVLAGDTVITELRLGDVADDHLIELGGSAADLLTVVLGHVVDTTLTTGATLKLLQASSWTRGIESEADNLIQAARIDTLTINGDFGAQLLLTTAGGTSINKGTIAGAVFDSMMTLAGGINTLTIQGDTDGFQLNAAAGVTTLTFASITEAELNIVGSVTTLTVKGNVLDFLANITGSVGTLNLAPIKRADIFIAGDLNRANFYGWAQGVLVARSLNALISRGPLSMDLTLTGFESNATVLKSARLLNGAVAGNWNIAGAVGSIITRAARNWFLFTAGDISTLNLGLTHETYVETNGKVGSVNVRGWDGGHINASRLTSFYSRGDVWMDLGLGGEDESTFNLGTATIGGSLSGGWFITGSVNRISQRFGDVQNFILEVVATTAAQVASLSLDDIIEANISVDGLIKRLYTGNWLAGSLIANQIEQLAVFGDMAADVLLVGAELAANAQVLQRAAIRNQLGGELGDESLWTLNGKVGSLTAATLANVVIEDTDQSLNLDKLTIAGGIANTIIRAGQRLGTVRAASLEDSALYAGMAANHMGVNPDADDFINPHASIDSLTLTRVGVQPNLVNSAIAAYNIGSATLRLVETLNDGNPFGLAARQIGSLSRLVEGSIMKLLNLDTAEESFAVNDFQVNVGEPDVGSI